MCSPETDVQVTLIPISTLMKPLLLSLFSLLLVSCASPNREMRTATTPDLSVIHLQGKLTHVPAKSKWPASIKVGAAFDYWAVIDNRIADATPSPNVGSYPQKTWPSRYDLKVGDVQFSSDRLPATSRTFGVSIQDEMPGNADGYIIHPLYHATLPEAPDLKSVSFKVSVHPKRNDVITSDKLPFHAIATNLLTGGSTAHFRGIAYLADNSDQMINGKVDTFEVFQASAEAPWRAH